MLVGRDVDRNDLMSCMVYGHNSPISYLLNGYDVGVVMYSYKGKDKQERQGRGSHGSCSATARRWRWEGRRAC